MQPRDGQLCVLLAAVLGWGWGEGEEEGEGQAENVGVGEGYCCSRRGRGADLVDEMDEAVAAQVRLPRQGSLGLGLGLGLGAWVRVGPWARTTGAPCPVSAAAAHSRSRRTMRMPAHRRPAVGGCGWGWPRWGCGCGCGNGAALRAWAGAGAGADCLKVALGQHKPLRQSRVELHVGGDSGEEAGAGARAGGRQGHRLHVDAVALGAGLAPADTDGPLAQHAALHRLLGLLRVLPVAEAHKAVVLTLRQTAGQSSRLRGRRRVRRYGDPRVRAVGQTGACVRCARVGAKRGGKRAPS